MGKSSTLPPMVSRYMVSLRIKMTILNPSYNFVSVPGGVVFLTCCSRQFSASGPKAWLRSGSQVSHLQFYHRKSAVWSFCIALETLPIPLKLARALGGGGSKFLLVEGVWWTPLLAGAGCFLDQTNRSWSLWYVVNANLTSKNFCRLVKLFKTWWLLLMKPGLVGSHSNNTEFTLVWLVFTSCLRPHPPV